MPTPSLLPWSFFFYYASPYPGKAAAFMEQSMNKLFQAYGKVARGLRTLVRSTYRLSWGSFVGCLPAIQECLMGEYDALHFTFSVSNEQAEISGQVPFLVGDRATFSEAVPAGVQAELGRRFGNGPMRVIGVADCDADTLFSVSLGRDSQVRFPDEPYVCDGGYIEVALLTSNGGILVARKHCFRLTAGPEKTDTTPSSMH